MGASHEIPRLDAGLFEDLRDSLAGRPGALAAIYQAFYANAAGFIDSLRAPEHAARVKTLHALKGSAAMVGASRLASLAASFQEQCPQSTAGLDDVIEVLRAELSGFRKLMDAQLRGLGGAPKL